MAKALQGTDLANAQAVFNKVATVNYEQGARTAFKTANGTPVGEIAPQSTAKIYNYWDERANPTKVAAPTGILSKTTQLAGSGARLIGGAIVTSVKDIAGLAVNAAMAIPSVYNSVQIEEKRKAFDAQAANILNEYKQGRLTKQQYLDSLDQANQTLKDATKKAADFNDFQVNNNFIKTTPDGSVDWSEQLISTVSGGITLGSLGIGTALKTAVAGTMRGISAIAPRAATTARLGWLASGAGGTIPQQAAKTTTDKLITIVEQTLAKNKAWRNMADAAALKIGTSPGARDYVKNALVEVALRAPIRRENIRFTEDVLQAYKDGRYFDSSEGLAAVPSTLLVAATMLAGGPLHMLQKYASKTGAKLRTAAYGEATFYDELQGALGRRGIAGSIPEAINEIRKTGPEWMVKKADDYLKQLQEYNLQGRGLQSAAEATADAIVKKLATGGRAVDTITVREAMEDMFSMAKAMDLVGKIPGAAIVKYDIKTQNSLIKLFGDALNANKKDIEKLATHELRMEARKAVLREALAKEAAKGAYWTQNADVVNDILDAINNAKTRNGAILAPRVVDALRLAKISGKMLPKKVRDELASMGYAATVMENQRAIWKNADEVTDQVIKSKYVPVSDSVFQQAAQSKPFFRQAGAALSKLGLGLDETSQIAYRMVRNNASEYIDTAFGQKNAGVKVINALQQYVESGKIARTATDLRMLLPSEIKKALKTQLGKTITDAQAVAIKNAIVQAHLDVPMAIKGLANQLVDKAYQYNPLHKFYSRAQGAFRYTWNPFFRVQEIAETELLGQSLAGGKKPWVLGFGQLFPGTRQQLDDIVARMDKAGFFNEQMMATRFGEAAQDVFLGRVTANISKTQRRSLAAVAERMARQKGITVEDLIAKYPQDVVDMIRPIVQYPTTGMINSNLAKALNLAVFPSRYNMKVTGLAVKALAKAPPAVQLAVVDKLWDLQGWLRSEEGLLWQRQNADALNVLKWLTPIGSIQWVFDVLATPFGQGKEKPFDFGLIGGLPFGVIGQVLESQGVFNLSTPYIDPENADVYTKRIPESLRARAASALTDLLGSTFTYPGAILGLPGKGKLLREVAGIPFPAESDEWVNKINSVEDLPAMSQYKQEVWRNQYLREQGINVDAVPDVQTFDRIMNGETVFPNTYKKPRTKAEIRAMKRASSTTGASAGSKAKKELPNQTRTGNRKADFTAFMQQ